ncbi:MAG: AMP-binding protein [Vicingaceae bacterium]|nr:AMP-binding protein [Vicingaceae bacterium]
MIPISLSTLITTSEKQTDKTAFIINGESFSYEVFYQKVNAIANELLAENKSQQKVIVATNNDLETYASIIAIWLTGNTYIPLNFEEPSNKLKNIIKTLKPDVLLTSKPTEQKFSSEIKVLNTRNLNNTTKTITLNKIKPENIAYTLFTSGTTGTPKGVPISYKNLNAFVDSFLSENYSISDEDVFLQMADLTFDMSIISFLIPLCIGAKIVTVNPEDIKYLATYQALEENDISVLITAPSTLQLLEPYYAEINLKQLKYTFVGAEAFYKSTAKEWLKCAPNSQIVNLYGPSEGGILASSHQWGNKNSSHNGIVSIGKPVKNINLHIVDSNGKTIENSTKGEIWISGEQVFDGYLNPLENEGKFDYLTINGVQEKCFKTGDLAFRDDNGHLFYCGRLDYQVKIQGQRVELAEIEHFASQHSTEFKPVALCYKDQFNSNKIALFVENRTDETLLSSTLKTNLPSYMIPSKIIKIEALPLNKNQKTDLNKLKSYL